jgi:TolB-like protein/Tfp pilus assembly protein PilF
MVLPLANLTGDALQDFFVDGITEELTTDLAQIAALRVTSRTSATQAKNLKKGLPELAQALHVDAVVEGSVARSGDRVRITVQLIEAKTDRHMWAKSYERSSRDVLALQDELARDIASEIRVTLTPAENARLAGTHAIDPQAYDDYLRGRYFWARRTEPELNKAKEYFEKAIAKDPNYAPAYSGLADTYIYLGYLWGHMPPREAIPLSQAAARKAIELDDSGAEGHASLGTTHLFYDWDMRASEEEFKRATALNPNYGFGHHIYSVLLAALGRQQEAIAEIRKAADVDPLSIPVRNMLADQLAWGGRCDEAAVEDKRTIELNPNATHMGMIHEREAECALKRGLTNEWFDELMLARVDYGVPATEIAEFRKIYATSSRPGVLRKDLKKAIDRWNKDHWHRETVDIATTYAQLGDMDNAYKWIDKAVEVRSTMLFWVLTGNSPLRKDQRFEQMKRKMGYRE